MPVNHIIRCIQSDISIVAKPTTVWDNITNVKIDNFSDPFIFKLLNIPKPLSAEIINKGEGGTRIAYFNTGKRFIQQILVWKPLQEYTFSFNPEKGFRVGYFFDISDGVFRIDSGQYILTCNSNLTILKLVTTYSINRRWHFLLNMPVRLILKIFQRYLLASIKKNTE
jgi:hypothetical protein